MQYYYVRLRDGELFPPTCVQRPAIIMMKRTCERAGQPCPDHQHSVRLFYSIVIVHGLPDFGISQVNGRLLSKENTVGIHLSLPKKQH